MKNLKNKILILIAIITILNPPPTIHAEELTPEIEIPVPISQTTEELAPEIETPIPINQTVDILVRAGDIVLYQGITTLPSTNTIDIPDSTGTIHTINSKSVLGILYSLSQTPNTFTISNLEYYSSYNSFYLKCLTPNNQSDLCNNWQYSVNNTTPYTSMDSTILTGNEVVGIYFGSPHRVVLDNTSIKVGESLKATAENYNYLNNTWNPLIGVNIGITVPNPNDLYNPNVILSKPVDVTGSSVFNIVDVGSYDVGIIEDYYFPSYKVTVSEPTPISTIITSSGGGGGNSILNNSTFNISNALNYLSSVQNNDGSFNNSDMYTDWVAIALGAIDTESEMKTKVLDYMKDHNTISSMLTDNERHAMALLALGQNPYTFAGTDYITPIIKSFDGQQFGDSSLINDDIFALIPLAKSGYTYDDNIINKDIEFILSKQKSNGSWEDSVDITSAGIQALVPFNKNDSIKNSIQKASEYLQSMQNSDGSFNSIYSTSWVIGAMNILGESWAKNSKDILDSINKSQLPDGGVLPINESMGNRIWATSYTIPAVLGKNWNAIMREIAKPIEQTIILPEIKTEVTQTENPKKIIKTKTIKSLEQKSTITNIPNIINDPLQSEFIPLTANVVNSKIKTPTLVIIGIILSLGGLVLLTRRIIKKNT